MDLRSYKRKRFAAFTYVEWGIKSAFSLEIQLGYYWAERKEKMLGQEWAARSKELTRAVPLVLGRPIDNCRGTWTLTPPPPHQ